MKMSTLKDGTEVFYPVVYGTFQQLKALHDEAPPDFYDLVMLARDASYQMSMATSERLQHMALLETDGKPHSDVAAIIRNAVVGEGLQMRLVSPVKEEN